MTRRAHNVRDWSADGAQKPKPFVGARALVVDDMPVMGKILGKALRELDMGFHHVTRGQDALDAVAKAHYDVIFMDIMMPGMDGMETTRALRKMQDRKARCPIIAVTTKTEPQQLSAYRTAGMDDCMRKPVDRMSLEVILHQHLSSNAVEMPTAGPEYELLSDDLESVNWDTLREYSTVFKSGLKGLIQDYLVAAPMLLEQLGSALDGRDSERVHTYAAQFKSASVVFGAEKVSHLAAGLEIMAGKGLLEEADLMFFDLHMAYEQTKTALQKKLIILNNL